MDNSINRKVLKSLLVILLIYTGVINYVFIRYQGNWTPIDTVNFYAQLEALRDIRSISFDYRNGFAYQVLSVIISDLCNITIYQLQYILSPILSILVIIPILMIVTKEEILKTNIFLVCLLCMMEPYLLFSRLQGTHSKFSQIVFLVLLYLFLQLALNQFSLRRRYATMLMIPMFLALVLYNAYFSLFFMALVIGVLLLGKITGCHYNLRKAALFVTLLVLIYYAIRFCIFSIDFYDDTKFFFYAIDINQLLNYASLDSVYGSFTSKWKYSFFAVYVKYSHILVLFISFIGAALYAVKKRVWTKTITLLHVYVVGLVFYASFIVMDQLNPKFQEYGGNLALRLYEFFGYIAIFFCAIGLALLLHYLKDTRVRTVAKYSIALLICIFCILSPLKATMDPYISHRAQYFEDTELIAISNLKDLLHAETNSISPGPVFNEMHFPLLYKLIHGADAKNIIWAEEQPTVILNTQYLQSLAKSDPILQLPDTRMSNQIYSDGFNTIFFNIHQQMES